MSYRAPVSFNDGPEVQSSGDFFRCQRDDRQSTVSEFSR